MCERKVNTVWKEFDKVQGNMILLSLSLRLAKTYPWKLYKYCNKVSSQFSLLQSHFDLPVEEIITQGKKR